MAVIEKGNMKESHNIDVVDVFMTWIGTKRPLGAAGLVDARRKEMLYICQD